MSSFRLIDAEKARFPVSMLCRVLKVSKSGYSTLGRGGHPRREAARTQLSQRRSARSTREVVKPTVTRGFMPSYTPSGCAVVAGGWPG